MKKLLPMLFLSMTAQAVTVDSTMPNMILADKDCKPIEGVAGSQREATLREKALALGDHEYCVIRPNGSVLVEDSGKVYPPESEPPEPEPEPEPEPPAPDPEPVEPDPDGPVAYPEAAVTYQPSLPAPGQYTDGYCQAPAVASFTVTLQDGQKLGDAYDQLRTLSGNAGGTLVVPWDVDTVQCDNLWIGKNKHMDGAFVFSGTLGPNGQRPRFYCRSEQRDGTIPHAEVTGEFFHTKGDHPIMVENLHVDGYRKHITNVNRGQVIIRNNYLHHGTHNGISGSNNTDGVGELDLQICGNEIAHLGRGNAIHGLYIHRALGGGAAWNRLVFVNNLAHSTPYSSSLKSIANEHIILNNRFYGSLDTDPSYTKRYSSMLIDIPACAMNRIERNELHGVKPVATNYGDIIIGIRNRKTVVRGCDMPQMWAPGHDETGYPPKVDGPAHTEEYWANLNGEIQFPTIIKDNKFYAEGDYGDRYYAVTMWGTYPNFETKMSSPACWLPTPSTWYERARVYMSGNEYHGFTPDKRYRNGSVSHSYKNHCPEPYSEPDNPPPGPGPSDDMIEGE